MLNREEFVILVKRRSSDAVIKMMVSRLMQAPGRQPPSADVSASEWFSALDQQQRRMVEYLIEETAELCVFTFLSSLDMFAIRIPETSGHVELSLVENSKRLLLNDPDSESLHEIFNWLCQQRAYREEKDIE